MFRTYIVDFHSQLGQAGAVFFLPPAWLSESLRKVASATSETVYFFAPLSICA